MQELALPRSLFVKGIAARLFRLSADDSVESFAELGIELPESMESSAASRKLEFLLGRYAMREVLKEAGYQGNFKSEKSSDFGPIWPVGFVGSLSHSQGQVLAAATKNEEILGLGVDLENVKRQESFAALEKRVLNKNERERFFTEGLSEKEKLLKATLIFSAKECLFKCLSPLVQKNFWFDHAECSSINFSKELSRGFIKLRLTKDLGQDHPKDLLFQVAFAISPDDYVLSCLEWPQSEKSDILLTHS